MRRHRRAQHDRAAHSAKALAILLRARLVGSGPSPFAYASFVHSGPRDERAEAEVRLRYAREAGDPPTLPRRNGLSTVARVWIMVVAAAALWALAALGLILIL